MVFPPRREGYRGKSPDVIRPLTVLFPFLLLLFVVTGCSVTAKDHCENRQALWEHAFADEDRVFAEKTRASYVPSCTKMLSKEGARKELECRDKCLEAADRSTTRSSQAAKDAYGSFQRCEAKCLDE